MMDKILGVYLYLVARCKEPSSHNAIAYLLGLAGINESSPAIQAALFVLSAGFGATGFFVKEALPKTKI
jgi:hypothetical protein